ncbi:hypothetical protein B0H11DRAFT_1912918 [Mycena galericulata]|nr:hypothetical protein B0H11DRAFT_1912918 [Mycena galericulata]
MDKFYDDEAAGIDALPGSTFDPSVMSVKTATDGFSARIMTPEAETRKEAVISIVGILKASELPPVRKMKLHRDRIRFLRQRVTIAGFDAEVFKTAVNKVEELAFELASTFESNKVENWGRPERSDCIDPDHGLLIRAENRYFFSGRGVMGSTRCPFNRYVDPDSILSNLQTADLAHCFENEVSYLEFKNKKYGRKDPAGFRQGDIVEVGVSIVAFTKQSRDKGDTYVCKLVMRTLTLLSNELTKVRLHLQISPDAEKKQNAYLKRAERELLKRSLKPSGLQDNKGRLKKSRIAGHFWRIFAALFSSFQFPIHSIFWDMNLPIMNSLCTKGIVEKPPFEPAEFNFISAIISVSFLGGAQHDILLVNMSFQGPEGVFKIREKEFEEY